MGFAVESALSGQKARTCQSGELCGGSVVGPCIVTGLFLAEIGLTRLIGNHSAKRWPVRFVRDDSDVRATYSTGTA